MVHSAAARSKASFSEKKVGRDGAAGALSADDARPVIERAFVRDVADRLEFQPFLGQVERLELKFKLVRHTVICQKIQ